MPNATYNPNRTYLVCQVGPNYLVRGNEPLNPDGSFAYDALNAKLGTLIQGFELKNFKLIDISLIDDNPASERGDLALEFSAYGFNQAAFDKMFPWPSSWPPVFRKIDVKKQWGTSVCGQKGSVIWYPVQGCTDSGNCKAVEPPQFDFIGEVKFLQELLTTEKGAVVYNHCEHGHDRTSALMASYMMKYMGKTLTDVLTKAPPDGAKAFKHAWETNYEQLVRYYAAAM